MREPLFKRQPAEPLEVRKADSRDDRHFWIEGMSEGFHFEDRYVAVSGYFGSYNPNTFAAAPDLLEAVKLALPYIDCTNKRGWAAALAIKNAIAKAEADPNG